MKAAMNCSRKGSAAHNERKFDLNKANHINQEKTSDNIYLYYGGRETAMPKFLYDESSLREKELEYYKKNYSESLQRKNSYYKRKGLYDHIKTIEEFYEAEKSKPEEFILQFGNKDEYPDPNIIIEAFNIYMEAFNKFNRDHSNRVKILDATLHMDEATPHWHVRRVFEFEDKYGMKDVGIKRALEQAGIDLPDPEKEEGRYNNAKMRFDAFMRDLWITIGRRLGLQLDNAPKLGKQGELEIREYKMEQIKIEIENNENYLNELTCEINEKEKYTDRLNEYIDDMKQGALDTAYELIDELTKEIEIER